MSETLQMRLLLLILALKIKQRKSQENILIKFMIFHGQTTLRQQEITRWIMEAVIT